MRNQAIFIKHMVTDYSCMYNDVIHLQQLKWKTSNSKTHVIEFLISKTEHNVIREHNKQKIKINIPSKKKKKIKINMKHEHSHVIRNQRQKYYRK